MSIKILIDMNLSPEWIEAFESNELNAVHWSQVSNPREKDSAIMEYARKNKFVVFTHDLDFGSLLAATNEEGPSVIQVRTQDNLPDKLGDLVISAIKQYQNILEAGALIVIDEFKMRARILPLKKV